MLLARNVLVLAPISGSARLVTVNVLINSLKMMNGRSDALPGRCFCRRLGVDVRVAVTLANDEACITHAHPHHLHRHLPLNLHPSLRCNRRFVSHTQSSVATRIG